MSNTATPIQQKVHLILTLAEAQRVQIAMIGTSEDYAASGEDAPKELITAMEKLERAMPAHPAQGEGDIDTLRRRLEIRLNDYLCEMKPEYDDSITGFNEAWDIMREVFQTAPASPASGARTDAPPQEIRQQVLDNSVL